MTNDNDVESEAEFWDEFVSRYGIEGYMEVRYGLGEQGGIAELRLREQPTVER